MKRNPETVYCRLTIPVPWWRRCMACRLDFRWERGWAGPRRREGTRYRFCLDCVPTEEKAREIFGKKPRSKILERIGDPPELDWVPVPPLPPKRSPWSIEFDSHGQPTALRHQVGKGQIVRYSFPSVKRLGQTELDVPAGALPAPAGSIWIRRGSDDRG